jgi:hypothetical protein
MCCFSAPQNANNDNHQPFDYGYLLTVTVFQLCVALHIKCLIFLISKFNRINTEIDSSATIISSLLFSLLMTERLSTRMLKNFICLLTPRSASIYLCNFDYENDNNVFVEKRIEFIISIITFNIKCTLLYP